MPDRIRSRLTYANVMATIAVFGVLGGGGAYASSHLIGTDQIENGAVTTPKLANGAVTFPKLGPASVQTGKLAAEAVTTGKIANNAVEASKLAEGAVTHDKLACKGNDAKDVMVRVGSACIDRYEASIWDAPTGGNRIAGPIPCAADGHDCTNIYARSVAGVPPRGSITWFQAQQALANSGKRLPSNSEWQMAVAGTPDHPGPCNTDSAARERTGTNPDCVSNHGANDMVGNVWEWVGDWVPRSTNTGSWDGFSDDLQSLAGAATNGPPGALIRGGNFSNVSFAGPFAILGNISPSHSASSVGFRGAR